MLSITSPSLLVDKSRCMANIRSMKEKADRHGLTLKPHVKTHQSADIGRWLKETGIQAITVSSVQMAAYFAENGWEDITIAFPVNIREIDWINSLASRIELTLLISDIKSVSLLDRQLNYSVSAYLEIDTGSNRTGFNSNQTGTVFEAAASIRNSSKLTLRGLYSHPGHSYGCRSAGEIKAVHDHVREQMTGLKNLLISDSGSLKVCTGDTPCSSIAENFNGIDEISPGNFVFYDLMQTQIGSCSVNDIAVVLACPVTAVYPDRQEIAIHGGAVHLSKEYQYYNTKTHYGLPVKPGKDGWSDPVKGCYVKALSQEHGVLTCSPEFIQNTEIGDIIGILPVHSCLTADLMMGYHALNGEKINHIRASQFYR